MPVLVDTSVYIESIKDAEVQNALEKIVAKILVLSSEVIDDEIDAAVDFLRKTGRKEEAEKLKDIYRKIVGGSSGLSNSYSSETTLRFGKRKAEEMKNDLRIVSSASIGGINKIVAINKKTMASDKIMEIYRSVNSTRRLKTPGFLRTKEELLWFAASL